MQTHGELTNREMINVKKWKFKHLCTAAPCTVYPVCILANPILTYLHVSVTALLEVDDTWETLARVAAALAFASLSKGKWYKFNSSKDGSHQGLKKWKWQCSDMSDSKRTEQKHEHTCVDVDSHHCRRKPGVIGPVWEPDGSQTAIVMHRGAKHTLVCQVCIWAAKHRMVNLPGFSSS